MLDIKLGPALLKIFNGQTLEKFLRSVSDEEEKFYKISTWRACKRVGKKSPLRMYSELSMLQRIKHYSTKNQLTYGY